MSKFDSFVWWLNFVFFVANFELVLWYAVVLNSFYVVGCIVALMNLTCCIIYSIAKEFQL